MIYTVYLIISNKENSYISYVGYTSNLQRRLRLHNSSKGAKFTRGRKWKIAFTKEYFSRSEAMSAESKLKKNYKLRKILKENYINKS